MGQRRPERLTNHPTLSIRLRLLLTTRRPLHSLSGVGLTLAVLLSATGAFAQGMGGMGDPAQAAGGDRWWSFNDGRRPGAEQQATGTGDEFPRIIRTRLRGSAALC